MLNHALRYAKLGWHIFPLKHGGKTPITKHGVRDATTEEAEIRDWWTRWPNANIGLACGAASGVYVIDIDYDEQKDINGYESIKQLGELPATVTQLTPRGGAHYFFHADDPTPNKNGLRPGIDIRGDGYYVVLAPSIHPNGGVYRWVEGCSPFDGMDLADYPDFMRVERERVMPSPVMSIATAPTSMNRRCVTLAEKWKIGQLYFERVEIAIEGQKGDDMLFWAARCAVVGLRMSQSEAYDFLAAVYNPRCIPPWDLSTPIGDRQFRHKISDAETKPFTKFPYGWILDDPAYSVSTAEQLPIDRAALIASIERQSVPAIATSKKSRAAAVSARIPDELRCPTGWLGEYIGYVMRYAPYPNWPLACAGGLALMSAVSGRKVFGPSGLPTNLYVIGLALPGTGKNFPRALNARILEEAGGLDILADKLASAEGLEDRIAEQPHILLCQPDEMDSLIRSFEQGRDGRSLALCAMLLQLYTSSGGVYVRRVKSVGHDSTRQEPIIRPHLSLFGTATPRLYYEACGRRLLEGGFAARVLVLEADPRSRGRNELPGAMPPRLIEWVAYWLNYTPPDAGDIAAVNDSMSRASTIIQASECGLRALAGCQDRSDNEYGLAERTADAGAAAVWSRVYEQVEKIATLCAIGDGTANPLITSEIVAWAEGIVNTSARNALRLSRKHSADSPFAERCNRVMQFIADKGGTAPQRDILRRFKLSARDAEDVANSLVAQGLVELTATPSRRGPATITWVVIDE